MNDAGWILEPITQDFLDTVGESPGSRHESPEEARRALIRIQAGAVGRPSAQIEDMSFPVGPTGSVLVRVVRPTDAQRTLPVIVYIHGGGWCLGGADTHDRIVRELAVAAGAALFFVEYDRSPEARYPVALEQIYAVTAHVAAHGESLGVDPTRLAVVGDGAGGNMAAAVTLLAMQRRGPKIDLQILFYPVTDADFATPSYQAFANGPWLTRNAMERFWDAYLPDSALRNEITAAPLRASVDQLRGLPDALIIVAENDVLRDEGEGYARQLLRAGVRVTSVRCNGTIHGFVVLNALADTPATRSAIAQAVAALRSVLD
ncbi:alpha/beta hydrolase [Inquilinus limosus]|uniref:alpha/beta hydrolase n=1 Tax=Inquilinus limosus TaxID=171674 RepID=UPI003F1394C4